MAMTSSGFKLKAGFTLRPLGGRAESPKARTKVPCGRVWPNGEFGLSWHYRTEESDPAGDNLAGGVSLSAIREECQDIADNERWLAPWLVKSAKSSQRPETYGRKGITGYGSKVVRSGCHLLQKKYGKGRLSFLTLTLPELPQSELRVIAEGWSDLIRQLTQNLTRHLRASGLPTSLVLVTELQPKRLESGSLGCLHLHAVFVGRHRRAAWVFSPQDLRSVWLRLLSRKVGHAVHSDSCENLQRVEKSAENYLSKYMTKGVESVEEYANKFGWDCVPKQWWTATSPVKNAVKKYTISGEQMSIILDEIVHEYWKRGGIPDSNGLKFCRPITLPATDYQDMVIGYFGKLSPDTYTDMLSLRDVLKSA